MSQNSQHLKLTMPADRALAACRGAIADLGWEIDEAATERRLVGREPPWDLCCIASPGTIEVRVSESGEGASQVDLTGSIGGIGPVSAVQLKERMDAFARRLLRRLDE